MVTNNAAVEDTVCVDVLVTVDLALVYVVNSKLDLAGMRQSLLAPMFGERPHR